ncbi:hypothetical protein ILUMI_24026 [Ignelater luminosus]|uniref:HTH psq-type domain-containing protein n=1 Tax=Ignelater luminosus TaxID=2038154 RepID=A0A8K0CE91_IGNLU|nr:hypothetical protein ILUMI_24026 [Ignelater luminosus]
MARYTEENMTAAINAVRNGMSKKKAEQRPPSVLTADEENTLNNIQEEHISPNDILENKIRNHENLHRSTPPLTSSTENSSPLEDVLFWPKTPKRKGKRNSERMPFVECSKRWKAFFQEKANKKVKLQQDKELRKKEREAVNVNKRKLKEIKQKERNIIKTNKKSGNEK